MNFQTPLTKSKKSPLSVRKLDIQIGFQQIYRRLFQGLKARKTIQLCELTQK